MNVTGGPSSSAFQPRLLGRRAFLLGSAACAIATLGSTGDVPDPVAAESGPPTMTRAERFAVQPDGIFAVRTSKPLVGLTFDDGPDPAYTPQVLDVLADFGVKATFFSIGANALAAPELLRETSRAGHEIGNHTQHHPDLNRLSLAGVAAEVRTGQRSLVSQGVVAPALFRPPKGFTSASVARTARAAGFRTVFWTHCVESYLHTIGQVRGPERLAAAVRPGSIILAHDGGHIAGSRGRTFDRAPTVRALPVVLKRLRERGLEPVAVATLLSESREHDAWPL